MGPKTFPTIWGIYMFNVYKNQQSRQTGSQGLGRIFCQRDYGPLLDHIKGPF
jgi:hypothetical protein